ncbi:hypothetical protein [Heliophilum fasciatum]|uniref:Uncharacterized protein n=1 Tax=Heliophilum fasciatum TaxID=35700 RepID=A0A4R2REP3_9FIRM|nr:hypothetical protein [Heliophilum fasciatum]MCW2279176.1 putative permease [Heliophilum fasciatum]TCP61034.1 hypothetical protein EDD73_13131 [Heliophilum fasciatum]
MIHLPSIIEVIAMLVILTIAFFTGYFLRHFIPVSKRLAVGLGSIVFINTVIFGIKIVSKIELPMTTSIGLGLGIGFSLGISQGFISKSE